MTEWTPSAQAALEAHFQSIRRPLEASGADASEVIEDLRRHLDQEILTERLKVVTEDDVRRLLQRIGGPEAPSGATEPNLPPASSGAPVFREPPPRPSLWLLVLGVIIPAITFGVEWTTAMCAGTLFDPMPTIWHELLVAAVPVINGLSWWAVARDRGPWRGRLGWANGVALGVSTFYMLLFLPLTPFAVIGLMYFGFGLLPLTPLLSVITTGALRPHLRRLGGAVDQPFPKLGRGLFLGLALMLLLELPVTLTRVALQMAIADDAATRQRGIAWLRLLTDEDTLLRECYGRPRWAEGVDLVSFFLREKRPVTTADARTIYYRVTGRAFNSLPPPKIRTARGRWTGLDDLSWDAEQGSDTVGGRLKGLSLVQSRLDGVAYPDSAVGYLEWTLEFKNTTSQQREARAQVQLPPGGVVSRLTLWVNGEEREAAFGSRGQVRQAYEQVVKRRRDPVLVTTCGPDRVLVQCFPVPPDGGTMKVRMGVTAPLITPKPDEGWFQWPVFLERNFGLDAELRHSAWLESTAPLTSRLKTYAPSQPKPDYFNLVGKLTDSELSRREGSIQVRLEPSAREVWTPALSGRAVICQRPEVKEAAEVSRVVVVVDGSVSMAAELPLISAALSRLPEGIEFSLVLASDEVSELAGKPTRGTRAHYEAAGRSLMQAGVRGGQDNLPALEKAWDLAAASTNGLIIWIHGPQPVLVSDVEAIRQRFERRRSSPRLLEVQVRPGPDRILEALDGVPALHGVPRLGALEEDLGRLYAGLGSKPARAVARLRLEGDAMHGVHQLPTAEGRHLERLWAREEVRRLLNERRTGAAAELSAQQQLVTPVTGAVVLETQQQFAAAGLQPVDAATVPAVPEPRVIWLLVVGALGLGWRRAVRHRQAGLAGRGRGR